MSNSKKIILILVGGFILRMWGIGFGLPYQFHQDEPIVVNHALAYGTGDLNPHFFIIPPLSSYLLFLLYGVYFICLRLLGSMQNAAQFASSFFKDPAPFYLIGRVFLGVLPSILNTYLTYRLAKNFVSIRSALFAAALMSVVYLNVTNGHYIYVDNLLVMFVLLGYIVLSRLIFAYGLKRCILAGIIYGLAVATKYNAIFLAIPFLFIQFSSGRRSASGLLLFIGFALLAFVIGNPFSILDGNNFLLNITKNIRHEHVGWLHHFIYSLWAGTGVDFSTLGSVGLMVFTVKKPRAGIFLLSFAVLFYIHLVFASQYFSRYVLVLIPFLAIGAGYLLFDYLWERVRGAFFRRALIIIAFILISVQAVKSVKADMLFSTKDTRQEALEWIQSNIPVNSRIAFDSTFFRPPVKENTRQLLQKKLLTGKQPGLREIKDKKIDFQIKARELDKNTYEVYYIVSSTNKGPAKFLGFWPVILNKLEALKAEGIEYAVFDNFGINGPSDALR
ncbi:MAG TPA: glycosyltransferase family 39 protein, partial [Candidatus Margulisiibacteriota bacterium]|nr:glycosyltransferase family 39 protein [Candidatus Margulisiibacteriota bacterium]